MIKKAIENFREMGLEPVIYRAAAHSVNRRSHERIGYYGAIPNKQFDYDHKADSAIYLDAAFVERKLGVIRTAYEEVKELAYVHAGPAVVETFDYDHKADSAIYLDAAFVERKLGVIRTAYEEVKELAYVHAGPAVVETFGEIPFAPETKEAAYHLSEKQQKLAVELANENAQITNRYIKGEERSFTIIAFPVPEIGADFEEIFRETVRINTLDYALYQKMQQTIIDTLDNSFTIIAFPVPEIGADFEEIFRETVRINTLDYALYQKMQQTIIDTLDNASQVHILGKDGNRTDLTVNLLELKDPQKETLFENCVADCNIPVGEVFTSPKLTGTKDPQKETLFENCVADCNIPVGEVFTSPKLTGTNGVLHVSSVYLNDLRYEDLAITFSDGMISDYSCGNFTDSEENKKYIRENILCHHESLPLGEFAIGTNTTAYAMAEKFGIEDKLPILIAEKMGPHFAVGDTCYHFAEDTAVFNPDGKEIIARDNEVSILRKTDLSKAYFGCHTDITIPYRELALIEAVAADGTRTAIIENGRFVLAGTEPLNEALG